jgi:plasmid stability protein
MRATPTISSRFQEADVMMTSMTIHEVDSSLRSRLCLRAARHGRSLEEEVREILRSVLAKEPKQSKSLAQAIHARFAPLGGVELELPAREPIREPEIAL